MNAARCSMPSRVENLQPLMVSNSLTDEPGGLAGKPLFSSHILKGLCWGRQCTVDHCCECHVKLLLYLYVCTNVTQKDFIGVRDNIALELYLRLGFSGGTETELGLKDITYPGEDCSSKPIEEKLILASPKWAVSFHRQGNTHIWPLSLLERCS